MTLIAAITGLFPIIISSVLVSVFTPTLIDMASYSQAVLGSITAWIIHIQYLPSWIVWIGIVASMLGQMAAKEAILASGDVEVDERLSGDSRDAREGQVITSETMVLA